MTLSEASNKVQQCKQVLMDFERAVCSTELLPSILNGPQEMLIITEKANFANHKDTVVDAEEIDRIGNEVEEIELEYDSSANDEANDATNSELDTRSTFLVGVSTRYGKAVRVNNKYIS
eukprot:gene14906-6044_t